MENIAANNRPLKPGAMPNLKLRQSQFEIDTWKRLLDFMREENIHLKNRLSEILKDQFDKNLLDEVELFLNRFIKEDELIVLLRNDLAELEKLTLRNTFPDEPVKKEIGIKLKHLQNNIAIAETQFSKLKLEFNNYLSKNM